MKTFANWTARQENRCSRLCEGLISAAMLALWGSLVVLLVFMMSSGLASWEDERLHPATHRSMLRRDDPVSPLPYILCGLTLPVCVFWFAPNHKDTLFGPGGSTSPQAGPRPNAQATPEQARRQAYEQKAKMDEFNRRAEAKMVENKKEPHDKIAPTPLHERAPSPDASHNTSFAMDAAIGWVLYFLATSFYGWIFSKTSQIVRKCPVFRHPWTSNIIAAPLLAFIMVGGAYAIIRLTEKGLFDWLL